jgi:hypothetical protein
MATTTFTKDPEAVLDYKFDWSSWLATGETISSKTVTVGSGLTEDSSSITDTNTSVTIWLSGGTTDTDYSVECKIVTSDSRIDERSITIRVRER